MPLSTDYMKEYSEAQNAYFQNDLGKAESITNQLLKAHPDDPNLLLLSGHIYLGLQDFQTASQQYNQVLDVTQQEDFHEYARQGLEQASASMGDEDANGQGVENQDFTESDDDYGTLTQDESGLFGDHVDFGEPEASGDFEGESLDEEPFSNPFDTENSLGAVAKSFNSSEEEDLNSPFSSAFESNGGSFDDDYEQEDFPFVDETSSLGGEPNSSFDDELGNWMAESGNDGEQTFVLPTGGDRQSSDSSINDDQGDSDFINSFSGENEDDQNFVDFNPDALDDFSAGDDNEIDLGSFQDFIDESDNDVDAASPQTLGTLAVDPIQENFDQADQEYGDFDLGDEDVDESPVAPGNFQETLLMGIDGGGSDLSHDTLESASPDSGLFESDNYAADSFANNDIEDDIDPEDLAFQDIDLDMPDDEPFYDEEMSLGGLGEELLNDSSLAADDNEDEEGFLEEFHVFNDEDLDHLPNLDMDVDDVDADMPDTNLFDSSLGSAGSLSFTDTDDLTIDEDDSVFSTFGGNKSEEVVTSFAKNSEKPAVEATSDVEQGYFAWFENAGLQQKQWFTAAGAGIASCLASAFVTYCVLSATPQEKRTSDFVNSIAIFGTLTTLITGSASFGATLLLSQITTKQIKRSTDNLQSQFDAVSNGNLNVKATVYSEDEFGELATGFNQMARVILTTTSEAQRRAEETEQSKEDLQRQVIRLLDDVEGAARGDLTVQAEVTADVLGAVADAFNLTIQNLREIVQQVKQAARQVNQNSADSESFARGLSSDALRQAEELAVTLNSVQMMTDSIQRVAENAREAEEVARTASATALKGGESVEHTVAGILQIRETVAETARKVKRLAESSQEISKIVAVISQIASRTNLLALNASIEAARAGESGKGFAIVADEVRQLADRSAKALKEIEQIVLQIQSETSLVMTAMEEGTQQVIDGTKRAEQAKQSLEDIIQVSNRIDALVRSITADTVEQRENSRAVAQVMQSVELTAQETSQESQRVAGSLQNLVGIARDLLSSVERFRVESGDEK
ncbi:methyl-accepting chemotaxis sensory transducer [[Leptolyngbya] sp. PCC 7376]|uniref:methyl-accepting chemotaxis protein n=1 Tax=[Leptolyngbya] sp. PCC 7376 TaxID=111781 RepID=UPI00029F0D14|nr:methyl-accepting chemotaxis protein [[Leptolyngbya] sp. PCC 7376]AFY38882.1 methyl-accepting chemotaxis sensory transducer [[Leptolyngbya] sp. PCC 7376]